MGLVKNSGLSFRGVLGDLIGRRHLVGIFVGGDRHVSTGKDYMQKQNNTGLIRGYDKSQNW